MAKKAEPKCKQFFDWVATVQGWELYWRKYKDVSICPHCREQLPKSDMMPDYVFAMAPMFVEVKESTKNGSFDFKRGITKYQRNFILSKWNASIFLELGNGRRGKDRIAYLMSWNTWLQWEEVWKERGWSSIRLDDTSRRFGVREELAEYQLEWREGKWTAASSHPLWKFLSRTFNLR